MWKKYDPLARQKTIKERLAFIDQIEEFPSMPSVVLPLMSKLNDPYASVKEIEKLVSMDPALVSYILKITNSLIFGLREEVYSIHRAIILIGINNLKSLVTSYSIRMLCKVITHSDVQEYLWNHSLAVAVLAKVISVKIWGQENPHAYTFGLLHDVGKIVLYMQDPQRFQETLEQGIVENLDFVQAEKKAFGYSHIEAGYFMVEKLRFSKPMKNIVLFHHNPEYASIEDKISWIVSLANGLAHNMYDNKPISVDRYLQVLKITDEEFRPLIESAQKQVEQYLELL